MQGTYIYYFRSLNLGKGLLNLYKVISFKTKSQTYSYGRFQSPLTLLSSN